MFAGQEIAVNIDFLDQRCTDLYAEGSWMAAAAFANPRDSN
jgi:hypothetical protein